MSASPPAAGWSAYLSRVAAIAGKDLKVELRTRENISSMLMFAVLVLVIFNFAFDFTRLRFEDVGAGIFWVAIAFSSIFSLSHAFSSEQEEQCLQALLLVPMDRSALYFGKWLAQLAMVLTVEATILPLSAVFFNYRLLPVLAPLAGVLVLNTIGFTAIGALLAAVAARLRRGFVLLPLLVFSVGIPLLVSAVEQTDAVLDGRPLSELGDWLTISIVYDVVVLAVAVLTFDFAIQEED